MSQARLVLAVVLALVPAAGAARGDAPLAPAGECAHAAPGRSLVRPVVYAPGGPVLADPLLLPGLASVAAGPPGSLFPDPEVRGFPGTGACDRPGSGCMGPIQPGPARPGPVTASGGSTPTIRESPSRPAPPPGIP
jgi:hypothetical protein